MKWILCFLSLVLFAFEGKANSFQLSLKELGAPFYRTQPNLTFRTTKPETGTFFIQFLDMNGKSLDEKYSQKIKKTDFSRCSHDLCHASVMEIPLVFEKYSCAIDARFVRTNGEEIYSSRLSWGECKKPLNVPDAKYLPDLSFVDDPYFGLDATIEIMNSGYGFNNRPVTVWGYLKDKVGNIIWRGIYHRIHNLRSDEFKKIDFGSPLHDWQERLSCTAVFILDPGFEISERSKKNNMVTLDYGDCEEVPSESNGDSIDFVPVFSLKDNVLVLNVVNRGRLPYTESTTSIESYVEYKDANKKTIIKKSYYTKPTVYGFGDSKEITRDLIIPGTCFVEIELNPNITIKESNYLNNRIELKVCE